MAQSVFVYRHERDLKRPFFDVGKGSGWARGVRSNGLSLQKRNNMEGGCHEEA